MWLCALCIVGYTRFRAADSDCLSTDMHLDVLVPDRGRGLVSNVLIWIQWIEFFHQESWEPRYTLYTCTHTCILTLSEISAQGELLGFLKKQKRQLAPVHPVLSLIETNPLINWCSCKWRWIEWQGADRPLDRGWTGVRFLFTPLSAEVSSLVCWSLTKICSMSKARRSQDFSSISDLLSGACSDVLNIEFSGSLSYLTWVAQFRQCKVTKINYSNSINIYKGPKRF